MPAKGARANATTNPRSCTTSPVLHLGAPWYTTQSNFRSKGSIHHVLAVPLHTRTTCVGYHIVVVSLVVTHSNVITRTECLGPHPARAPAWSLALPCRSHSTNIAVKPTRCCLSAAKPRAACALTTAPSTPATVENCIGVSPVVCALVAWLNIAAPMASLFRTGHEALMTSLETCMHAVHVTKSKSITGPHRYAYPE